MFGENEKLLPQESKKYLCVHRKSGKLVYKSCRENFFIFRLVQLAKQFSVMK
jgi:hypothetical protein